MKTLILGSVALLALTLPLFSQTPPDSPTASPIATPASSPSPTSSPAPTISATMTPLFSPTPSVSASVNEFADRIKKRVDRQFQTKKKHGITIDSDRGTIETEDGVPEWVGLVAIISVLAIFGVPVAIVAVIMGSHWAKTRSLHRTVRLMVEKGQPVPPELLASPIGRPLRPWYDLRRGIILLAVGTAVTFFFLAVAGFESGVWAFGLIPAIIGAGYILTWRLANKQENLLKQ